MKIEGNDSPKSQIWVIQVEMETSINFIYCSNTILGTLVKNHLRIDPVK